MEKIGREGAGREEWGRRIRRRKCRTRREVWLMKRENEEKLYKMRFKKRLKWNAKLWMLA